MIGRALASTRDDRTRAPAVPYDDTVPPGGATPRCPQRTGVTPARDDRPRTGGHPARGRPAPRGFRGGEIAPRQGWKPRDIARAPVGSPAPADDSPPGGYQPADDRAPHRADTRPATTAPDTGGRRVGTTVRARVDSAGRRRPSESVAYQQSDDRPAHRRIPGRDDRPAQRGLVTTATGGAFRARTTSPHGWPYQQVDDRRAPGGAPREPIAQHGTDISVMIGPDGLLPAARRPARTGGYPARDDTSACVMTVRVMDRSPRR